MSQPLFQINPDHNYQAVAGLSVCEEIVVFPDDPAAADLDKEASRIPRMAGGTSLNITAILRNTFDMSVKLLAAVSFKEKDLGRGFVSRRMDQLNIDWHPLPILDGCHTAVIIRREGSTHKIYSDKRPIMREMIDEVANQIRLSNPALCIASGAMPNEVNMIHAMFTTRPEVISILNPRVELIQATDQFNKLLPHTDLLILNHQELSTLIGQEVTCESVSDELLAPLHNQGVSTIILTCGTHGAIISQPRCALWHHQPAIKAPRVIDPTGAGDSFTAATAAAILLHKPPQEAMRWGAAMASRNVGKEGGTNFPTLDEFNEMVQLNL